MAPKYHSTTKLPRNFFEENPLGSITAGRLTYYHMVTLLNSDFQDAISEFAAPLMNDVRKQDIQSELELIANATKPEEVVLLLKKVKDPTNKRALCCKVLDMEDEVIPLIINRLKRSRYDIFIEAAVLILAHADEKYIDELIEIFPDIQGAYARSEVCVLFAYKERRDALPLIIDAYYKLQWELAETDNDWEQGPLFAIYLLTGHIS